MLRGVLDLFFAQPFGQRSLLQRILTIVLSDDIRKLEKDIDILRETIEDDGLCDKLKNYVAADPVIQNPIRQEVLEGHTDLITAILRSEDIKPALDTKQIIRMYSAFVAWNEAIDAVTALSDDFNLSGTGADVAKQGCHTVCEIYSASKALRPSSRQATDYLSSF